MTDTIDWDLSRNQPAISVDNFITAEQPDKCWHCGKETDQIEVNFEAYLHQGNCAMAKWIEYMNACLKSTKVEGENFPGE